MKPTIFKIAIAKLTLLILVVLMYGCNNSLHEKNSETPLTKQSEVSEENTHSHSKSDSIELNNGAKWKVVPEMMTHIRNMESDMVVFSEGKHNELKNFTQLGESLQKNIDLLTSNCTMEGKAHDELHKWLLPYIDLVDKLNKSKNNDEALIIFKELKLSYETFNYFFE